MTTVQIFDEAYARALLGSACAAAGLPEPLPGRARLLALGENAVFDLGDPAVVVKIGRGSEVAERARREVAVARWLAGQGVPAPRPYEAPGLDGQVTEDSGQMTTVSGQMTDDGGRMTDDRFQMTDGRCQTTDGRCQMTDDSGAMTDVRYQPTDNRRQILSAHGHPVTFWHRLPPAVRPVEPVDLAPLLRTLHQLPAPPFPLGRRDLLAPVDRWLASAEGHIDPADAAFLRARRAEYATALAELTPALPPGVIHGDALPRNVHLGPDGPVLLDLETVADDLREHDLVVLALSHDRYGVPAEQYTAFTAAYGWDVREWSGFAVLRGARETASACWVAQQVPGNAAAGAEFARRVGSLREGATGVRWYPF